jgi:hypothetical protein
MEHTIFANNGYTLKLLTEFNDKNNQIEHDRQQKHEHELQRKKCVEYIGALSKAISTACPYRYVGDMNDEQKREYHKTNISRDTICVSGCVPITTKMCPELGDIAMLLRSNNINVNGKSAYGEEFLINGINSHNGCKTNIHYDSKNKNLCIHPPPNNGNYFY